MPDTELRNTFSGTFWGRREDRAKGPACSRRQLFATAQETRVRERRSKTEPRVTLERKILHLTARWNHCGGLSQAAFIAFDWFPTALVSPACVRLIRRTQHSRVTGSSSSAPDTCAPAWVGDLALPPERGQRSQGHRTSGRTREHGEKAHRLLRQGWHAEHLGLVLKQQRVLLTFLEARSGHGRSGSACWGLSPSLAVGHLLTVYSHVCVCAHVWCLPAS